MLNWFGRRKSGSKPAAPKPASAPARIQARDVIAQLSGKDGATDLAAVTEALEDLTDTGDLSLDDRFDEIHALDTAGQPRLFDMIREYLATPRQKKFRESELWGGAYNYLQQLYEAYLLCIQRYEADPGGTVRFRPKLPTAVARALRALRLQLKWALLRYVTPEQRIWTEMAELYTFAVSNGIAEEEVPFYSGRQITVREEFVKGLMIAASSNDSLRPPELDLATRLVDYYSRFFVIAGEPLEHCTHWFNMDDPGPPVRSSRAPPEGAHVQYFGAGAAALAEIEAVQAHVAYAGTVPQELMFYEKQDDQLLLGAIKYLSRDWAGKTQARKHERKKTTARITVVPGLPEIIRALDFAVNDSLDFTDATVAESWIVEDVSEGGYGAVIPSVAGDWVEVGGLIGVEGNSIREWRVGVIRRVNRLEGNQQRVGVQLISTHAELVKLTPSGPQASVKTAEPAVLLSQAPDMADNVEVLVRSGMFTSMDDTEMFLGDKQFRVTPTKVLERNARAERVVFCRAEAE